MKKILATLLLTLPLMAPAGSKTAPNENPVLTSDNTLVMNEVFSGTSVANLTKKARELDFKTFSNDPIYLVINSPGGSIDAGLELIENLSNLKRPVKTINLFSASMGFQTTQGLGERLVTKDGTLMSHKARGSFSGEFPGQLDNRYNYYLKRITRLDEQAVKRSQGKQSLDSYRSLIENEFWCDGQDCVDFGFADRVVKPSCDKSLDGTYLMVVEEVSMLGSLLQVKAEFDVCPLNTNYLRLLIYVDGKPLFQDISQKKAGWFTWPTTQEANKKYSAEVLFEIQKKVTEIVTKLQNKEVVKGY